MAKKQAAANKAHPYADLFPMMDAVELEALAADIKANGQDQPIVMYGDLVLDGRNRLAACKLAAVEPVFTTYEGDDAGALAKVISLNVQRRDLTPAQRAIVAARTWMAAGDTRDKGKGPRRGKDFTSLNDIAQQFKTSKPSVQQARDLLTEAPDLATQVVTCAMTLAAAYDTLKDRNKKAEQRKRDLERVAKFRDAIRDGEMTIEEALELVMEEEREQKAIEASQADARRHGLSKITDFVKWITTLADVDDQQIAWYGENGPGFFDHGLNQTQVRTAATVLDRFAQNAFRKETRNGKAKK